MAEKCGLSVATIKQIERGKKDSYSTTINSIAKALNISIDYLFGKEYFGEQNFLDLYYSLTETQKKALKGIANFLQLTGDKYIP